MYPLTTPPFQPPIKMDHLSHLPQTQKEYTEAMWMADEHFTQMDETWEKLREENASADDIARAYDQMCISRNMYRIVYSEWEKAIRPPTPCSSATYSDTCMHIIISSILVICLLLS